MTDLSVATIIILIGIMGAVGAVIRHSLSVMFQRRPASYRFAITAANILGSGAAGFALTVDGPLATIFAAGFLGSLTTFSTIAVWIADDLRHRELASATTVIVGHLAAGVAAVAAGFAWGIFLT
jgi:fluoride exporter